MGDLECSIIPLCLEVTGTKDNPPKMKASGLYNENKTVNKNSKRKIYFTALKNWALKR